MEEIYGVCVDGVDKNYLRRLPDDKISTSLGGRFMFKECAEQLCRVLHIQGYTKATVVRLFRNGEDEAPAEGLLQLGNERLPINEVWTAVTLARKYGNSAEEIIQAVNKALDFA